jgi:D-3-phosphoglycerate dehydrogenase / 2-oxoglutarate reductase
MKILFTAEYDEEMITDIQSLGDVTMAGWAVGAPKIPEEQLAEMIGDYEIIITSYDGITKKVIDAAPKLKLIACTRATPVNVDCEHAKEKNIPVLYTPGRNSDSAAELTIALMINCARHIPQAFQALHQGKYCSPEKGLENETKSGLKEDITWGIGANQPYMVFKGMELKGRNLGIIGFGSIGRRVATIAKAFGMNILVYDPYAGEIDVDTVGQTKVNFDTLLQDADFVSCHVKITPATRGMMGKEQFAKMKPTAYFINTSRAAAVDEEALVDALKNNLIAGAALDVFASEPIACNHPLIRELGDRVVVTPHIAGATADAITNHTRMIVSDIKRFLADEPLLYAY